MAHDLDDAKAKLLRDEVLFWKPVFLVVDGKLQVRDLLVDCISWAEALVNLTVHPAGNPDLILNILDDLFPILEWHQNI